MYSSLAFTTLQFTFFIDRIRDLLLKVEETMILKRIDPMSCAKVSGVLYTLMGLIFGVFFSIFSMIGAAFGGGGDSGMLGVIFGVGAIILMPIFYGVLGFIAGGIMAWIYNKVADWMGGVEVEFDQGMQSN